MPKSVKPQLEPRKSPVQARSSASADPHLCGHYSGFAGASGKERLTTTKVAARAGVSVGTLYQYFPNKSSLLQAVLRKHMEEVTRVVEAACASQRGAESWKRWRMSWLMPSLLPSCGTLRRSKALHDVSDDVGGAEIVRQLGVRGIKAIAEMLESSGARFSEECR